MLQNTLGTKRIVRHCGGRFEESRQSRRLSGGLAGFRFVPSLCGLQLIENSQERSCFPNVLDVLRDRIDYCSRCDVGEVVA